MAIVRRPENLWPALWVAVLVVLATVIATEHFFGRVTVGEGPRAPAKIVEAKLLPAFALPADAQSGAETVARPLFVPTRRPSPPAASTGVPTMKKGQFVLTGVTVAPDTAFAFLKEVSTGKTQSVKKGTQVNGITVDAVEPRRVVLKQGEESEELPLNTQVPARVATAPAPSGAVPSAPGVAVAPATRAVPVPGSIGAPMPPGAISPPGATPAAPGAVPGAPVPAAQPAMPAASATPAVPAPASGRRRPWINAQ